MYILKYVCKIHIITITKRYKKYYRSDVSPCFLFVVFPLPAITCDLNKINEMKVYISN